VSPDDQPVEVDPGCDLSVPVVGAVPALIVVAGLDGRVVDERSCELAGDVTGKDWLP